MASIFKLLFDLSLYYGFIGFFVTLFFDVTPFFPGFAALCAAVVLNRLLSGKVKPAVSFAVLLLPPLLLFLRPELIAAIHMLPAWIYLLAAVKSNQIYLPYEDFKAVFQRNCLLVLVITPIFLISNRGPAAMVAVIPYFAVMLVCGIGLLRILRENARGTGQALIMLLFAIVCILLTVGQAPQLLASALGLIYNAIVRPALLGIAFVAAYLIYWIVRVISHLLPAFDNKDDEEAQMDFFSVLGELGYEDNTFEEYGLPPWVTITLSVLLALVAIFLVIVFLRKLLGYGAEPPASSNADRLEDAPTIKSPRRRTLTRPRDPRLAVRYYYGKFLRECRKRGLRLPNGATSEEISRLSADFFPGEDPALLREFYIIARYSQYAPVTADQADRAAALWRSLKRTKYPPNNT